MKILFLESGKTKESEVASLSSKYYKRIGRYVPFEVKTLAEIKNVNKLSQEQIKEREGELILKELLVGDHVILLDEAGKSFNSIRFANHLQGIMNRGPKRIVFVIGGPYGFSQQVYAKASEKLSLSDMTFSHQIIRPIFAEQLYRAFTILNNEPYHHQ